MDYRTGKCSQCGAEYKVPASFAHNAARCKKCQGVVHLSPAPAAAGGAPKAPASAAPGVPAKRVVPKAESARPAAPEAKKPEGAPAARPAAPAPAKGGTLERLKTERAKPAEASAPAKVERKPEPSAAKSAPSRSEPGREKRASHVTRHERHEKKAPVAGILSVAALVIVAAVLLFFRESIFGGGQTEARAPELAAQPSGGGAAAPAPTPTAAEDLREPAETTPLEAADAAEKPAEKPKAEAKAKDPATIDLAAIPDFQPTQDTTPEEWAKMNEWAAQWMDVDAGAAGNRAKLELIKQTRKAVPVILNAFKRLDFATKEGRSNGDQCQKTLMQICNGTNFDWKYADEAGGRPYGHPDDVWFCKRVVELWSNSWKQAETDIRAWIKIAKLEDKDPAEAKRLLEMFGGQSPPDAGSGDDLEVD
jgi:hypothetical protein